MKKAGKKTYLNEDEESLVIVSSDIECGHGLPFDCCSVAKQLHNIVKSIKSWCGDKRHPRKIFHEVYFQKVIKRVNKEEEDHEDQQIILVQG